MAGIYIHIPFCHQPCHYCNFHFAASRKLQKGFLDALKKEMGLQRHFFEDIPLLPGEKAIKTVYFGGGTPSIFPSEKLITLIEFLAENYPLEDVEELTLETNPEDLNISVLEGYLGMGVNRLSIGVQSFHCRDLEYLNRMHTSDQGKKAIKNAQKAGFSNISADLIYGIPTLTDAGLRENLHWLVSEGVPHISAYALTVEDKTPLAYLIAKGRIQAVSEDQSANHFSTLCDLLTSAGYIHYELSNFALPGMESQHNLSYWTGVPYLGLGPSAHSYKDGHRFWNIENTTAYIDALSEGILPVHGEKLSQVQAINEYIMTSLRTIWGCNLDKVSQRWGEDCARRLSLAAKSFIHHGLLTQSGQHLVLTPKGKFLADGIAAELFFDESI